MNQNHFTKDFLFQQNIDAQELNWSIMNANWDKEDYWLGELDCYNNFPSFHNLNFDELVAHKFIVNEAQGSDFSLFDSIKVDEESSLNLSNQDILVAKYSACENKESNLELNNFKKCSSIHKEFEDKTTHVDSAIKHNFQQELNAMAWIPNEGDSCVNESSDDEKELKSSNIFVSISNPNPSLEKYEEEKAPIAYREVRQISIGPNTTWNKTSFKRWGKDKDKLAFEMLKDLCKERGINVDQFMQVDVSQIIDEYAETFANNTCSIKKIKKFIRITSKTIFCKSILTKYLFRKL